MSAVLTIRLTDKEKGKLEKLAESTGRTKSYLASEAVRHYLDVESWQIAEIKQALQEANAKDFASEREIAAMKKKWK